MKKTQDGYALVNLSTIINGVTTTKRTFVYASYLKQVGEEEASSVDMVRFWDNTPIAWVSKKTFEERWLICWVERETTYSVNPEDPNLDIEKISVAPEQPMKVLVTDTFDMRSLFNTGYQSDRGPEGLQVKMVGAETIRWLADEVKLDFNITSKDLAQRLSDRLHKKIEASPTPASAFTSDSDVAIVVQPSDNLDQVTFFIVRKMPIVQWREPATGTTKYDLLVKEQHQFDKALERAYIEMELAYAQHDELF